MKGKLIIGLVLASLMSGCSEIKNTSHVKTSGIQIGNETIAGVGEPILKIVNKESLPNVFGAADIFGRTRDTGTTSIIFLGSDNENAYFLRRDVDIHSEKTTMNSSPTVIHNNSTTTYSGTIGNEAFFGTANTSSAPIYLPPNTPEDRIAGVREMQIKIPLEQATKTLRVSGKTITILDASTSEVRFIIQ